MRILRRQRALWVLACVGSLAVPPAGATTVSDVLERLAPAERVGPSAGLVSDVLDAARLAPLPTDCLTPVLLAVANGEDAAGLSGLLRVPEMPRERLWMSASGLFRVHYTTRPGSEHALQVRGPQPDDVSDELERIDAALESAYRLLVDGLGFQPPVGVPFIDVYIASLGPGVAGAVVPSAGGEAEHRGGVLVLAPDLDDFVPTAAHQLAHLVELGYSASEPLWWQEASAAWIGVLAAGDASAEMGHVMALLSAPEAGLAGDDLERMRGALLLPAFLSMEESSRDAVRAVWEECAAFSGDNLLEALERVSDSRGRGGLQDLLRAFYASWVADSAGRSRLEAALGVSLPAPVLAADVTSYPAAGTASDGAIGALGASFLHFVSRPGVAGGLDVSLQGTRDIPWDALLLVRASRPAGFAGVSVPMDDQAQGRIRFPWSGVSDSLLVLTNAARDGSAGRLSYVVRHESLIPFDLLGFHGTAGDSGVVVEWTTDGETDLYGWNLYRSSRPDGGFRRLNAILIPAAGADRLAATYTYLDSTASGRKVYYYLEALTVDGFRDTTHVIGAYAPRPTPAAR